MAKAMEKGKRKKKNTTDYGEKKDKRSISGRKKRVGGRSTER